ncbi:MAG: hypothetical protein M1268_04155 [Patescibacteria group bacterium]|nr:hypothetical protein [Patescibacteria group bacterium]
MRKIFAFFSTLFFYLFFIKPAFADVTVDVCSQAGAGGNTGFNKILCGFNPQSFGPMVGRVIIAVIIIAIIIAVFFLIIGGIRWITSGGDKSKVEGARNQIVAAIVGLIIAILAYFIISFVAGLFGITITNLTIPNLIGGSSSSSAVCGGNTSGSCTSGTCTQINPGLLPPIFECR